MTAPFQKCRSLDEDCHPGIFLTNLSKVSHCLDHDLLTTKLEAFRLDRVVAFALCSCLKNSAQRTKLNTSYSQFSKTILGVPQGSFFHPLLFNIYICDMFYERRVSRYCWLTGPKYSIKVPSRIGHCFKNITKWNK